MFYRARKDLRVSLSRICDSLRWSLAQRSPRRTGSPPASRTLLHKPTQADVVTLYQKHDDPVYVSLAPHAPHTQSLRTNPRTGTHKGFESRRLNISREVISRGSSHGGGHSLHVRDLGSTEGRHLRRRHRPDRRSSHSLGSGRGRKARPGTEGKEEVTLSEPLLPEKRRPPEAFVAGPRVRDESGHENACTGKKGRPSITTSKHSLSRSPLPTKPFTPSATIVKPVTGPRITVTPAMSGTHGVTAPLLSLPEEFAGGQPSVLDKPFAGNPYAKSTSPSLRSSTSGLAPLEEASTSQPPSRITHERKEPGPPSLTPVHRGFSRSRMSSTSSAKARRTSRAPLDPRSPIARPLLPLDSVQQLEKRAEELSGAATSRDISTTRSK